MRSCIFVVPFILWLCPPGASSATFAAEREAAHEGLSKVRVASGGRSFETTDGQPFVPLGVNYFRPGTGWAPKVWQQFDVDAIRHDFEIMRELGVTCVRVFLTLGSFYPTPGELSPAALSKFDQFLAIAEEHGIYIHPTGPDHWEGLPEWSRGDRIARESYLEALEEFWHLFAERYRGRHVLFAYDLLNEPQVPWGTTAMRTKWPRWIEKEYETVTQAQAAWGIPGQFDTFEAFDIPSPKENPPPRLLLDYQHFRESVADEWTRRQAAAIKSVDPDALVTVGLIQWSVPSLLPRVDVYSAFRPNRQARYLDFLEVHFYPLAKGAYGYRSDDEESRNLAYLESVVREVARVGKPVVVGEFGWYGGGKPSFNQGRQPEATEEQQARWCRNVLKTTAPFACGWLNWGLYDHPEARDVTELTGLLTQDGRKKAWGHTFESLASKYRYHRPLPILSMQRPVLDWEQCIIDVQAGHAFRERYLEAFRRQPAVDDAEIR